MIGARLGSPAAVMVGALVLALAAFRYAHDIVKLAVEAPTIDFAMIYGFTWALGAGVDPFSPEGLRWVDRMLPVQRAGTPPTFPPGAYLLFLPFVAWPWSVARLAWFVVGQACLAGAVALLYRRLRPEPLLAVAGLFVVLTFQPIQEDVALGTVNLALLGLVTLAMGQHVDGRVLGVAVPLALAANLKLPYAALIPLLAWLGSPGTALLAGALAAGASAVAAVVFGTGWIAGYWRFLSGGSEPLHAWERNLSPHGVLHRLLRVEGPSLAVDALALVVSILVVAAVVLTTRHARRTREGRLAAWALALAALPLASPLSEENHFPVLLVPLAFVLVRARELTTREAACFVGAVLLLASRYSLERFGVFSRGLPSLALAGKLAGVVLLAGLIVHLVTTRKVRRAG